MSSPVPNYVSGENPVITEVEFAGIMTRIEAIRNYAEGISDMSEAERLKRIGVIAQSAINLIEAAIEIRKAGLG